MSILDHPAGRPSTCMSALAIRICPHCPPAGTSKWPRYQPLPLRKALEEPEKQIILAALEANDWNRQKTAQVLDINRTTLYKKIKQYGLGEYGQTG